MSSRAHNLDNCYVPQQDMQGLVRNVMCDLRYWKKNMFRNFLKFNLCVKYYSIVINYDISQVGFLIFL
jgi:hypothetical protein